MADIHDIEEERDKRMLEQSLKDIKNWKGFEIDFDIRNREVLFTGSASGDKGEPGQHQVRFIAYDISGPTAQPYGALRMTRAQWEEFKKLGDGLLETMEDVSKQ